MGDACNILYQKYVDNCDYVAVFGMEDEAEYDN